MDARTETARLLHDDHRRMLDMIDRVEAFLGRHGEDAAPDLTRNEAARALIAALARDVDSHFAFEEQTLFPLFGSSSWI